MTDETPQAPPAAQLPAVQAKRTYVTVHSETALFDTAKFEQIARVAQAAYRSSFLPEHLRKDGDSAWLEPDQVQANCFVIASMAYDFGVGFMPMAQSISMVHGKTMFEGKFIAAMIERRIGAKLLKSYSGEPGTDGYTITLTTANDKEAGYEPISGSVGEWATKEKNGNRKAIWMGANKQKNQLFYMAARVWCRLNEPGIMLGIYGEDEFDDSDLIEGSPIAPARISAGFAGSQPAPDLAPPEELAALRKEWEALRAVEKEAGVGTPAWLGYSHPLMIQENTAPTRQDVRGYLATVSSHINTLRRAIDAAVDEKRQPGRPAAQEGGASTENKGSEAAAAVDEKPAAGGKSSTRKKGLSKAMRAVLEKTRGEVDQLGAELCKHHPNDDPDAWLYGIEEMPADDEAGQALLGRFNVWLDKAKRTLVEIHEAAAQSPPPPPPPPMPEHQPPTLAQILSSLADVLRPLHDWPKIKETFNGFARQPEWKAMDQAAKNQVYALVWEHVNRINSEHLQKGEPMPVQPHQDVTAFRCAIEACPDAEAIQSMWETLIESEAWKAQKEPTRDAVAKAAADRMAKLRAG